MQFTKLRLTGFKSFVDPTDLIISDGLTGVVGPNGCGKSNLLEALRWVMGENRPTAMRSGGLEDVIFAGAATRPARNYAEVALYLDNTNRTAPIGFNDSDQLEVIRRVTRDIGSAYKSNGKDVRARDIQMLFADASTGSHSPALVRQGQISELINAKPKARRRILEEAAGISGLYQRRHEAELKLKGAETNLTRVDDVIEQLAQQLAQLERQAKQAARFRVIGEELRKAEGVLLYRRWKEADEALLRAADDLRDCTTKASQSEASAREATKARQISEEKLPSLREAEAIAGALLQRLQVQRDTLADQEVAAKDRIDTLQARIEQLAMDIDRESNLNNDAGDTIARLEKEAVSLAQANSGHAEHLKNAEEDARAAATDLQDQENKLSTLTEDVARLAARHQSAQRMVDDSQTLLTRSNTEMEQAKGATSEAETALQTAATALAAAKLQETNATQSAKAAEDQLTASEATRADTQSREATARAERSEAEGELNALSAQVSSLAKLLERDTEEGAQLIDQLQVNPGYEKALGAALADDLRAPEIDVDGMSGWARLAPYVSTQSLPQGAVALSQFVKASAVLARRLSQIGVVAAEDGAALQAQLLPGQRLVSADGDLWRWDGFRLDGEDSPSATALRLEQLNKLEELKLDLSQTEARADGAKKAHERLNQLLSEQAEQERTAREARRQADAAITDASRALSRTEADQNMAQSMLEAAQLAVSRHTEAAELAKSQMSEAQAALTDLDDLDAARSQVETLKSAVEHARTDMMAKRSAFDELRRVGDARKRRTEEVTKEITSWKNRLKTAEKRSVELADRKEKSEAELEKAVATPEEIAHKRGSLGQEITASEAKLAEARDVLSTAEGAARQAADAERETERKASVAREDRARAEALSEAAKEIREQAESRIRDEQNMSPTALLESLETDPDQMPSADKVEADVERLKRQREALGAVNLRAEEDAREVEEEHTNLVSEKQDLEEAIRTLRNGIANLNREGRERLLAAFDQVNENFEMLFKQLFNGGEANLALVESDDPLEAGLEIMCQPPGKKLATLSLLSGGEQTLTAIALIFAVFLANPAPICVLDEVDAPLDDANVMRFCDLLDEMCRQTDTRFMIITHHAVTMSRMDRLFGVTMAEQGVSQLVSVDLKKAEALVA